MTLRKILFERRATEHKLMEAVNRVFSRGSWMSTCAKKSASPARSDQKADARRYKDAKKRYDDTLKDCVKLIEQLRVHIQDAENEFQKVAAFKKMETEYDEQREQ